MGSGSILARAGFDLHFLYCFCCFSRNEEKSSKQIYTNVGRSFFGNPSPQKSHSDLKFTRFSYLQKNRLACTAPHIQGGGGEPSPKRHKKRQIPAFLHCFLVLRKNQKKGLASVGNFLEPRVPRRGSLPVFLHCILKRRNPAFLYGLGP